MPAATRVTTSSFTEPECCSSSTCRTSTRTPGTVFDAQPFLAALSLERVAYVRVTGGVETSSAPSCQSRDVDARRSVFGPNYMTWRGPRVGKYESNSDFP